ncbi:TM2 domain-containing protein [bacterium]|nr:TM2 domain-containing protein [bacterium]
MYCRHCGAEVAEKADICLKCGVRPLNSDRFCWNCGAETASNQELCIKCGVLLKKKSDSDRKEWLVTLLLAIFLGGLGIHRFYTGHIGTGILMLLTGGGCGIWWLIDIILIATGSFKDADGRELLQN